VAAYSQRFSRRTFVASTSSFAALHTVANLLPLPPLVATLQNDARLSQAVVADKGFASVRRVGNGLYATISDTSKGLQTMCNGGFLAGKDSALLIEAFVSPAGATFQMDAFRTVSQVPVKAALDTHYHFDHSNGNSFYGANNLAVWAHTAVARRMVDTYGPMQGAERSAVLTPLENRVKAAKNDVQRQDAQSDVTMLDHIYTMVNENILALPNHPLDPTKLPMTIDLGGLRHGFNCAGVAINVAVDGTGTVEGTESCSRKFFVMVMAVDTCLERSAMLRAVSARFGDDGKICGAV